MSAIEIEFFDVNFENLFFNRLALYERYSSL
jgi:hypothetical protein